MKGKLKSESWEQYERRVCGLDPLSLPVPVVVSHSALVSIAATWLQKNHAVVVTEITSSIPEQPDAIGWKGSGGTSTLIECKVSRADFMADRDKIFRKNPEHGMGFRRYFLTVPGIVSVEELPPKWGLLELTGGKVRVRKEAERFPGANFRHEVCIMISALRRIGHAAPQGTSIKCYTYETKNRATLGIGTMDNSQDHRAMRTVA